jgi:hypothetical protein
LAQSLLKGGRLALQLAHGSSRSRAVRDTRARHFRGVRA